MPVGTMFIKVSFHNDMYVLKGDYMDTNTVSKIADSVFDSLWNTIGVNGQFFVCFAMFLVFGTILLYVHDDKRGQNQGFWKWLGVQIWKDLWKSITQEKKDTSDREGGNS